MFASIFTESDNDISQNQLIYVQQTLVYLDYLKEETFILS